MKKPFNIKGLMRKKGFTIAELLIATIILAILVLTASGVFTNFYNAIRNVKAANVVYEEARFTMERIVKEIRNGTIDYEEYYNVKENVRGTEGTDQLGKNYCQYSRQFFSNGPDGVEGTFDDVSTGISSGDPVLSDPIQEQLYLINTQGNRRVYIKRTEGLDSGGNKIGKVAMLKLIGRDYGVDHVPSDGACAQDIGENDGLIDSWECDEGFKCFDESLGFGGCAVTRESKVLDNPYGIKTCQTDGSVVCETDDDCPNEAVGSCVVSSSFIDITPKAIDILDLSFIITPTDDPYKGYNDPSIQIQPNVTIKLVARANPRIASEFKGKTPTITLESTVSARSYNEITTECNIEECTELSDPRPCPNLGDLYAGATVTCQNNIWPACDQAVYLLPLKVKLDTMYANLDSNGEVIIIEGLTPIKYDEVTDDFVTSAVTTDSNGNYLDNESPFTAEGGRTFLETGSEFASCLDEAEPFRGNCKTRRCSDGLDNDGNGKIDNDDPTCLFHICNNGVLDAGEICRDIGGICYFRPLRNTETEFGECFDGYDNDCDYDVNIQGTGADEFDQECIDMFCSNGLLDPPFGESFANSDYQEKFYLLNDDASDPNSDLNEGGSNNCPDIGGLCEFASSGTQNIISQETGALCYDGLDNDCDGFADELDSNCEVTLCENNTWDNGLIDVGLVNASQDYSLNYLVKYVDKLGQSTSNDEICTDIGGLCEDLADHDLQTTETRCTDGLDNDCDGLIDELDLDCCPDDDGDGYYAIGVTCPREVLPPNSIDCDDTDPNIHPGVDEICTVNEVTAVDNNCSAINNTYGPNFLDDGWDYQDKECCTDTDGDGFGVPDAYTYTGDAGCTAGLFNLPERPPFDCQDANPDVHPNVQELNTASDPTITNLCTDGINNNCRISSATDRQRIDHIDMYANEAGGITQAFTDETFEPECCIPGAMEICDDSDSLLGDGSGSDENCNGKEGFSDNYCIGDVANGLMFFDNFNTNTYINTSLTTASHDSVGGSFTITPDPDNPQEIVSKPIPLDSEICTINVFKIEISTSAIEENNIIYEVSNDGFANPANSILIRPGERKNFTTDNKILVFKAYLDDNNVLDPSILYDITLMYTCN